MSLRRSSVELLLLELALPDDGLDMLLGALLALPEALPVPEPLKLAEPLPVPLALPAALPPPAQPDIAIRAAAAMRAIDGFVMKSPFEGDTSKGHCLRAHRSGGSRRRAGTRSKMRSNPD